MKKHAYNFVDKIHEDNKKLLYRKVFVIVDTLTNKYVLLSGEVPLFFRSKDARKCIATIHTKETSSWKVIKVQADLMKL